MFSDNKKKGQINLTNQQNKIAAGTKIVGDVFSEGGFRIDGEIEGNIETKSKIVLGKQGIISGTIQCANADVEGKIVGKTVVHGTLSLKSTAIVEGEVYINKLAVEPGATFNASCHMASDVKSLSGASKKLNKVSEEITSEKTA